MPKESAANHDPEHECGNDRNVGLEQETLDVHNDVVGNVVRNLAGEHDRFAAGFVSAPQRVAKVRKGDDRHSGAGRVRRRPGVFRSPPRARRRR